MVKCFYLCIGTGMEALSAKDCMPMTLKRFFLTLVALAAAVAFQMDQEYIEGEFWAPNGRLYIRSQYLGTYDDDYYDTVDEVFLGNIMESGNLTVITDEGLDLAVMVPQGNDTAELQPMGVTVNTASGSYNTTFYSMQYYMWDHKNQGYHPYNENAGGFQLPFTMTRLPGTRTSALVTAPAMRQRTATKASVHHGQPKAGEKARNSMARKKSARTLSPTKD